jgi:hypothetical protein
VPTHIRTPILSIAGFLVWIKHLLAAAEAPLTSSNKEQRFVPGINATGLSRSAFCNQYLAVMERSVMLHFAQDEMGRL